MRRTAAVLALFALVSNAACNAVIGDLPSDETPGDLTGGVDGEGGLDPAGGTGGETPSTATPGGGTSTGVGGGAPILPPNPADPSYPPTIPHNPGGPGNPPDTGTQAPVENCASGSSWTSGSTGSALMNPGLTCVSCHAGNAGPDFSVAGTVYATLTEADRCNGVNGGVTVELTDNAGTVVTLPVNAAGNFSTPTPLVAPLKVRLLANGRVREMTGPAPVGDCNACHTAAGANGAPGRILAP